MSLSKGEQFAQDRLVEDLTVQFPTLREPQGYRYITYPPLKPEEPKRLKATSKNVIPAKAGIHKLFKLLDSRLRGSDELGIIRGSLKYWMIAICPELPDEEGPELFSIVLLIF